MARQRVGRGLRRRMHLGRIMDVTSEGANLRMATHPTTPLTTLTMHLTLTRVRIWRRGGSFDGSSGSIPDDDQGDEGRLLEMLLPTGRPRCARLSPISIQTPTLISSQDCPVAPRGAQESGLEGSDGAVCVLARRGGD